jgi:hypothetical protein
LIDKIIGTKSGYSISFANAIRMIPDRFWNQGKEGTTLKNIGNAIGITSRLPVSREDLDAHAHAFALRAAERVGLVDQLNPRNFFGFRTTAADPNAPSAATLIDRFKNLSEPVGARLRERFKNVVSESAAGTLKNTNAGTSLGGKKTKFKKVIKFRTRKRR